MATEKIALYNLADLKNTSDDAIPNYLNSLKFKQSYVLQDVRLGLGYGAFSVAALCFLWDYRLGWDATKYWTAAAVAVYMVLNAALTYWMTYKEKNVIYQGTAPSGDEITISTTTKKNVPIYNLDITVRPKRAADGKPQKYTLAREFAGWFDEVGFFVAAPFQEMLASAVPLIGKQDPKRVKASAATVDASPDLLDAVLAASATEGKGEARQRKA
ncbi:Signal peptidase complex subunit 2 [Cordyceps fumosorosea ARSEF 2679]|uniref:Signal peptidase complex subunit 2 n=1 Tax=Cordyceps fumosorosea (strain ARSEF 2679) TaxID=1081104 RepID=A0A168CFU1_CORFA|nr:Signal peptidase complex subunit 2 [Cordyceps fumosorosea ARSEF 2679]OAA71321.1 Signal peptidase complex subunit 2 [Cordyceps fumosorosea ARSEF 2679]